MRGGITTVIIPEENVKDLADIPDEVKTKLHIVPATLFDDVLKVALIRQPEPMTWDQAEEQAPVSAPSGEGAGSRVTAH